VSEQLDGLTGLVAHLKEVFKDENPHQYTIEDSKAEEPTETWSGGLGPNPCRDI
jgi:hypothetical protein